MSLDRFRQEMIQVAAVAVAIIEDLDHGQANFLAGPPNECGGWSVLNGEHVLKQVGDERLRQDEKWGPQHHDLLSWLMILVEEVGEAADEFVLRDEMDDYLRWSTARLGRAAKRWLKDKGLG